LAGVLVVAGTGCVARGRFRAPSVVGSVPGSAIDLQAVHVTAAAAAA
jgi:hypothetical protein